MLNRTRSTEPSETRRKLVDAGIDLMRARGYNATTVDDICTTAGVTKGGFFHYFKSKDEIAKAALTHFYEGKVKDYEEAPFRKLADPLERVFGRLDYVQSAAGGTNRTTKGCLIGVFAQEMALANPELRGVCQSFFEKIAVDFGRDLSDAKAAYRLQHDFDPKTVATLYVAIVQGSLMMAKAAGTNDVVVANIEQFRQFLKQSFGIAPEITSELLSSSTAVSATID